MKITQNNIAGVSSSRPRLKAWEIHEVTLKSVEYACFEGKKETNKGQKYEVLRVCFEGKDGIYEESVFCPQEGDEVRQQGSNGNDNPSRLERFQFFVAHLGEQLAPERYAKMKNMEFDLPKDFQKYVETLKKVLLPAIGKTTHLKLIGTAKGDPCLPYFVNVSKEGVAYMSNNFLGDKLFFTDYELTTMERRKNAKPTDMSTVKGVESGTNGGKKNEDEEIDFDI